MSNNTTYPNPNDNPRFLLDYHPILITCSAIICITNVLVITLFLTQASLRSTANYLLFSLAISDLAVGLLGIPINIACEMLESWSACVSSYSVNRFIAVSTVYHILWITLEKYFAIIYPLWHKSQFDKKKVKQICVCTWLGSVLLSVVELIWLTQHDDPYADYTDDINRKDMIYSVFIFTVVFVFPVAVMTFAYISIFLRILRQHSNEFLRKHMHGKENSQGRPSPARFPRCTKSALLFFVILVVFIMAWFWWFFMTIHAKIPQNKQMLVSTAMLKLITVVRYSTAFVNPILYTFFKRDFNKVLRKFIKRSRLRSAEQQGSKITPVANHSASMLDVEVPRQKNFNWHL